MGDNTPSGYGTFQEAPHNPTSSSLIMRVLGNHDEEYYNQNASPVRPSLTLQQTWTLDGKTICALGFNSAVSQKSYDISASDIIKAFNYLQNLPSGAHIMVFTHNPLFEPINDGNWMTGASYDSYDINLWVEHNVSTGKTVTAREVLVDMLLAYRSTSQKKFSLFGTEYTFTKSGCVIGCFCGHIHNHVKCRYRGIFMEAFGTNGANEWTKDSGQENAGLYTPENYTIVLDPSNYLVNGKSYSNRSSSTTSAISVANAYSGKGMGTGATGAIQFYSGTNYYPKFRQSRYIGYSDSSSGGVVYRNNNNGFWFVNGITLSGSGVSGSVKYIRFDVSGRLRYYSLTGHANTDFIEISGYQNKTITFTANGYTWKFVNGLYNGYTKA